MRGEEWSEIKKQFHHPEKQYSALWESFFIQLSRMLCGSASLQSRHIPTVLQFLFKSIGPQPVKENDSS